MDSSPKQIYENDTKQIYENDIRSTEEKLNIIIKSTEKPHLDENRCQTQARIRLQNIKNIQRMRKDILQDKQDSPVYLHCNRVNLF